MSYTKIPLTTDPNQNFTTTIPINNKNITLTLDIRYNGIGGYWFMSVTDKKTGNVLIDSLPLLTGEYPSGDILHQYQYLGIGSATVVKTGNLSDDSPDSTNLGTNFVLLWGDTV